MPFVTPLFILRTRERERQSCQLTLFETEGYQDLNFLYSTTYDGMFSYIDILEMFLGKGGAMNLSLAFFTTLSLILFREQ